MKSHILSNFFLLLVAFGFCISPSLAGSVTRVEQTDASVTYAGSWYRNDNSIHSGGSAALTNAAGAHATITFTGTGITWVGASDPWSGVAFLNIDGTVYSVDNYSSTTTYQRSLFAVRGLAAGSHTLTIQVTHTRNINGSGSWVWIDYFEVENGPVATGGQVVGAGLTEQNSPALIYTGTWYSNPLVPKVSHSGGSAALAMDPNTSVTISFNGTGIAWTGYCDEWSGIAKVYVDGKLRQIGDTYRSPGAAEQLIFQIGGLVPGTHSLTIQTTGAKRPESNGTWIWVDAFHVWP